MLKWRAGSLKAPGEKLVRVRYAEENGLMARVRITGDFFIHPETAIDLIEKSLANLPIDENTLTKILKKLLVEHTIELVGLSAESIARAIAAAPLAEQ